MALGLFRTGVRRGALVVGLGLFLQLAGSAFAAAPAASETQIYEAALRLFRDGFYEQAERELGGFLVAHPAFDRAAEARLFQGQARYRLGDYTGTVALLRDAAGAGDLADQYQYWVAEALFQLSQWNEAEQGFQRLLAEHPGSTRRLEASLGEAFAAFQRGDSQRTADLLSQPAGSFQQAAQGRANDELVLRGWLLLAEARLRLRQFQTGEEALGSLAGRELPADLGWRRDYLLARLQAGAEKVDSALQSLDRLVGATATNASLATVRAEAYGLMGQLQEKKGDAPAAIAAYQKVLDPLAPGSLRHRAVQEIVRMSLERNQAQDAIQLLESVMPRFAGDPSADFFRLTLAELKLREYFQKPEDARRGATNLLAQAAQQLRDVLSNTNGLAEVRPKAQLDLGWCYWEGGAGATNKDAIGAALPEFQAAAEQLPTSVDQAVARFKMADCQYALGQFPAATSNYWMVVTNYAQLPEVRNGFADLALYQILRGSIESGDMAGASRAVETILAWYPQSYLSERGYLLFGQAMSRQSRPAEARTFLAEFARRFPSSPLAAEAQLAVARTFQQEGNWNETSAAYDRWVGQHTNHAQLPRVEFDRAWSHAMTAGDTNAVELFTQVLSKYPTNDFAPLAQYWLADHHWRAERFDLAELNYQMVYQNTNWPLSELSFQAWLMAGRSALARPNYAEARTYLVKLINHPACPSGLLPEAYFTLGTAIMAERPAGATTNSLANYSEAMVAFEKIPQTYPDSRWLVPAWGMIGNCRLQLATLDPKFYAQAVEAYNHVLKSPAADVQTRSMAEVGIALALERMADKAAAAEKPTLLADALVRYLNVFEGKNLQDKEVANAYWVREAGMAAARMAEDQQRWDVAANLYRRLAELIPATRGVWDAKLQRLDQLRQAPAVAVP